MSVTTKTSGIRFKHPMNGYAEDVPPDVWVYVLLFGGIYFLVKGVWTHAVVSFVAAFFTFGVSWLIYPMFAKKIMISHYLRKGWIPV